MNISINERLICQENPTYIIAEMSANHGGNFNTAVKIIQAAKEAGADAIKLQTYTPDTLTIKSDKKYFQIGDGMIWEGRTLYNLYEEAHTPWEWFPELRAVAFEEGIDFFSSPFDFTAVDFLENLDVPAYKIASFELVDLALIKYVAATGKPTLISTGMAKKREVDEAVEVFFGAGGKELALLKCTSAYPAPISEMNLNTISYMIEHYKLPIGLSDHSMDVTIPSAARALGACIIEKHIVLKRSDKTPDSAFSLEPAEFKNMVKSVRTIEKAMGNENFGIGTQETLSITFRRSIFAIKDIKKGEKLAKDNIRCIRPGQGLAPRNYESILGKITSKFIEKGTPISWDLIE
ncbi:pseudaminic acid synthase [Desulfobacterales bacterium HSG17]|nr:pseudaminic acid synthase [Desulfobacterales bacterium HSG17]